MPPRTSADISLQSGELPECIAVFIDGYNSFYYDGPGLAMETAIIHDLIPFIDKTYNTLASKEGRIIGGISPLPIRSLRISGVEKRSIILS